MLKRGIGKFVVVHWQQYVYYQNLKKNLENFLNWNFLTRSRNIGLDKHVVWVTVEELSHSFE